MDGSCQPLLESCFCQILLDGQNYLMKNLWKDNHYMLMIFDMKNSWLEELQEQEIMERSQKLNPTFEASVSTLIKKIQKILEAPVASSLKTKFTTANDGNQLLVISSGYNIGNIPFYWKFRLKKMPPENMFEHLTKPLIAMVCTLNKQQDSLVTLLHRKDAEINEYKIDGAQLSRKYLETSIFDEKQFFQESTTEELVENVDENPINTFLSSNALQKLYNNVTSIKSKLSVEAKEATPEASPLKVESNKRLEPEDTDKVERSRREQLTKKLNKECDKQTVNKKRRLKLL